MNTAKLSDTRAYDVDSKLFHHVYADASWYGDRDKRIQAVCGATAKGLPVPSAIEGARLERTGATSCPGCELFTDRRSIWTIAFRKRTANRFQRVTNWSGSWDAAVRMAGVFAKTNGDLEIYFTITREAEMSGHGSTEDNGNILTDAGKRIRIVDNAELSDEIISEFVRVSGWVENKGRPGHAYMIVPNTDNHIICTNKAHVTNGAAYACANDAVWANGAHARDIIAELDTIDQDAMVAVMRAIVDSGREDLAYLLDSIDTAPCHAPNGEPSKITRCADCAVCADSDNPCGECTLAFLRELEPILRGVKLPDYTVESLFAESAFDCYA